MYTVAAAPRFGAIKHQEFSAATVRPFYPLTRILKCAIIMHINYAQEICMRTSVTEKKRSTNVYLNAGLLEEAKELDLNVSAISNRALEMAVRERRRERWIEENRAGIEALNSFVEEAGLFSDDDNFRVI
ncbi:type II toxin-antitoxin system CcdA family antitoxin [Enterobacter asburiae]